MSLSDIVHRAVQRVAENPDSGLKPTYEVWVRPRVDDSLYRASKLPGFAGVTKTDEHFVLSFYTHPPVKLLVNTFFVIAYLSKTCDAMTPEEEAAVATQHKL